MQVPKSDVSTCSTVIFSAPRLRDFKVRYLRHGTDLRKMVLIYIITCCVLSENGPNLDFVEKGHILPLMCEKVRQVISACVGNERHDILPQRPEKEIHN